MKKASQLERLRSKFGDMEHWDSGSKHAERDLGVISSAGVFDELGNMLSEPWSDSLLFAPVIDEASISKRQITSEIRKKAQVTYRCTQQHLHATIHLRYSCFIIVLRPMIL
jgi:hypothetical protein